MSYEFHKGDLYIEMLDQFHNSHGEYAPASVADVLDWLIAEGGKIEWRCQHGRGGERLCREVNSYEPKLHATCGKVLVIPVSASRSTPNG